ncbi:MAG: DUF4037 domain-containing protein [Clostridia bacterium]|nr:DUF4037 domain-containing protein [Clostridia bacterium]
MRGMELCRRYWENYGREMLSRDFPEIAGTVAAGLCGSGSEVLGYDDEISRDHDFEPGFCLFLPGENEVDRRTAFRLERAYAKLPAAFEGCARARISPVGGSRHGVIRLGDFLREKTGREDGEMTLRDWMTVPEQNLLEATGGEIWMDESGVFTGIRERLSFFPEDIRLRKLSGELLILNQSGQYNYRRCLNHGEKGAAMLAVHTFVRAGLHALHLMEGKYMPYYKWAFRSLREMGMGRAQQAERLERILYGGADEDALEDREFAMADFCQDVAEELRDRGLSEASCCDMEQHAYAVADHITDPEIRNMHILSGI